MTTATSGTARERLCSRGNADRIAQRLCEETTDAFAVVRTQCTLQPYRVKRVIETEEGDAIELEVVAL